MDAKEFIKKHEMLFSQHEARLEALEEQHKAKIHKLNTAYEEKIETMAYKLGVTGTDIKKGDFIISTKDKQRQPIRVETIKVLVKPYSPGELPLYRFTGPPVGKKTYAPYKGQPRQPIEIPATDAELLKKV